MIEPGVRRGGVRYVRLDLKIVGGISSPDFGLIPDPLVRCILAFRFDPEMPSLAASLTHGSKDTLVFCAIGIGT